MKVLCVINRLITGGAEKLVLDSAPLLNQQCQFDVYLLSKKQFPFEEELVNKMPGIVFKSKLNSLYNPLHIFKIINLMRKYDIVHVHLFPSQYFVLLAKLLSFSKTKIVVTEHNTTNNRLNNRFLRVFDKITYKVFAATICISEEIHDIMRKYTGLPPQRLPIIENGILLEKIYGASKLNKSTIGNISDDDVLLLQVSGFRKQKDQQTLIRALKLLPLHYKACFAGTGETLDSCIRLVDELGLKDRVIFLGVRTDVPRLLKTADVVVLSSHYEGLSLASIEGMASGRPFVASDVPGLHEVVKGAGLLFDNKNHHQLARHVTELMANKEYYNQVAAKCQERARRYDIQTMVNKQVELYKHLCPPKTDEKEK